MVAFAFLLRYLDWWMAGICALAALLHNVHVLPRTGRRFFRDSEEAGGLSSGIVIYPLTVMILIGLFPARLHIAAAGWAILSFGDGFATLVGKRYGGAKLPWNRDKSWAGLAGYTVSASIGATVLLLWCAPGSAYGADVTFLLAATACIIGSLAAAITESFPLPLDDNLTSPLVGAVVVWGALLVLG